MTFVFFAVMFLLNAVAPRDFVNESASVSIAGQRANLLDGLLFVGVVFTVIQSVFASSEYGPPRNRTYLWSMGLLWGGLIGGATMMLLFLDPVPPRWKYAPLRNMLAVILAIYLGFHAIRSPKAICRVVWVVFVGSLGSAVVSVIYGRDTTIGVGEGVGNLESLRASALQVTFDAGQIAACLLVFTLASGIRLVPRLMTLPILAVCALGMFFVPHRSSWITSFLMMAYAGFVLWRGALVRKAFWSAISIAGILFIASVTIGIIDQVSGKDMTGWTIERLVSLLPGDKNDKEAKAWDTRIPGATSELKHWVRSPLLGGGFGVQVMGAMEGDRSSGFQHMPWTSTLAQTGPLGLAGFMTLMVGMIVQGRRIVRQADDRWMILLGVIGAVWGLNCLLMGFFSLSWNAPRGALALGLLGGVTFRVAAMLPRTTEASEQALDDRFYGFNS